jgi:hypothetical protein
LAAGGVPETPEVRNKLRDLTDHLTRLLSHPKSDTLIAEIKLSKSQDFLAALQRDLASRDLTLAVILDHLDRIQAQISRMSEAKATNPASSDFAVRNDYLFVIMPFGKEHVDTYDAIRRAVLKVNPDFTVDRVDEKPGVLQIMQDVWTSLESARLIICDLTDERQNVYYELGYAHALGKPAICVAREQTKIHFDVSGFRVTKFGTYRELEEQLAREMAACLRPDKEYRPGNVQNSRTRG